MRIKGELIIILHQLSLLMSVSIKKYASILVFDMLGRAPLWYLKGMS